MYPYRLRILCFVLLLACVMPAEGQVLPDRCSNTPARSWWNVQGYDLQVAFDTASTAISGSCTITATVTGRPCDSLQIDLDSTLQIDSVWNTNGIFSFSGDSGIYYVHDHFTALGQGDTFILTVSYHGKVKEALRAPWDGGMVRARDSSGNPWMAIACQSEGGSVWFPCKNFQGDEPEHVMVAYTVPEALSAIGNGRLQQVSPVSEKHTRTWTWSVASPINNYDITFYIGRYVHWSDSVQGRNGLLRLDYYVLPEHLEQARRQFAVVKPMLQCFEEKIGPYPFYEDGYKLVEAPYLGMEHQSAVAYGNGYQMGYEGMDRSETGAGLDFDFIIIHESGHEWFGNSITSYDKADTWIHEGFTSYTETIFEECLKGKERAFMYQRGKKHNVKNNAPVQGKYDQCDEGSADHYDKAAFMIHMIRVVMDHDSLFFAMLRDMNRQYYHRIVAGHEIETFINSYSGRNFDKIFDQYLRMQSLPGLEIRKEKGGIAYRWINCTPGFNMPVLLWIKEQQVWVYPEEQWKQLRIKTGKMKVSPDFLINTMIH